MRQADAVALAHILPSGATGKFSVFPKNQGSD